MNKRQKIAVVILNILIIAELFISMYLAHKDPENFSLVFFKYFFMMLIPTLILTKVVMKRLRTEEPQLKTADYDQKVVPPVMVSSVEFQKTIAAYSGRGLELQMKSCWVRWLDGGVLRER